MIVSPPYKLFNSRVTSKYLLKDAIYKGFSIHTPEAVEIWELLLNNLLENLCKEFGYVQIIRTLPQTVPTHFLSNFYNESYGRVANRIPSYIDKQGVEMSVMTDALPYLYSKLNEGNVLFSTYTVVRPRTIGVKPLLRDEFIRYFQFVISSNTNQINEDLKRIERAIFHFFKEIRLFVVAVDRYSDSYYEKKSCLHALWSNGNVESVLQCGILKKSFDQKSPNENIIFEIGGAQRLLATFIYNNSDVHGLFLPCHLRNIDIIIRSEQTTKILDIFIHSVEQIGCRIKYMPEALPLSKVKNIAKQESAVSIVVKRSVNEKEFITVYNRDMTSINLYSSQDIADWVSTKYNVIEGLSYERQESQIGSKINNGKLYLKGNNKCYALIKNGLFN